MFVPHSSLLPQEVLPSLQLFQLATGYWISQSLYVAAKLGIADKLRQGPCSVEELATYTQAHRPTLFRLLRALASVGVFSETEDGCFALTPLAEPLQDSIPGSLRGLVLQMGEAYRWQPWGQLLYSVQTGSPAFARLFGAGVFDYYAAHPEAAATFHRAMSDIASLVSPAIVAAYDFSDVKTLVDVGGGYGVLLSLLLQAYPHLQGRLIDTPAVCHEARRRIDAAGLSRRCVVTEGNFFESIPTGGDAYLMQFILHDWADEEALALLRVCRDAMSAQSRLLVIEAVIPSAPTPCLGKLMDLEMLVVCGGRERTEAEYQTLLTTAGFSLQRVLPTLAPLSILECRPLAAL